MKLVVLEHLNSYRNNRRYWNDFCRFLSLMSLNRTFWLLWIHILRQSSNLYVCMTDISLRRSSFLLKVDKLGEKRMRSDLLHNRVFILMMVDSLSCFSNVVQTINLILVFYLLYLTFFFNLFFVLMFRFVELTDLKHLNLDTFDIIFTGIFVKMTAIVDFDAFFMGNELGSCRWIFALWPFAWTFLLMAFLRAQYLVLEELFVNQLFKIQLRFFEIRALPQIIFLFSANFSFFLYFSHLYDKKAFFLNCYHIFFLGLTFYNDLELHALFIFLGHF